MSDFHKKIGVTKRNIVTNRNNCRCILCGKSIKPDSEEYIDKTNIEHIIPLLIFKWTQYKNNYKDTYWLDLLNSDDNIAVVHVRCNDKKGNRILSNKQIKALHTPRRHKEKIIEIKKEVQPLISQYLNLHNRILIKQNNKCYKCGRYITYHTSTIRRINKHKQRSFYNACALCATCNYNLQNHKRKNIK